MRNSRERSTPMSATEVYWQGVVLTIDTLLVRKGLVLLSLVPLDDKSVTEGQCRSGVCGTGDLQQLSSILNAWLLPTYNSSQLNRDLASVVSICFTTSCSKSSAVVNSRADCSNRQWHTQTS
jgi:hypothetical protein